MGLPKQKGWQDLLPFRQGGSSGAKGVPFNMFNEWKWFPAAWSPAPAPPPTSMGVRMLCFSHTSFMDDRMREPFRLSDDNCWIIGMIHVGALPGTPHYGGDVERLLAQAEEEARIYRDEGVDALLVENMHDVPYLNRKVGPEITAAMTLLGHRVKAASGLDVGLQILAGANREAMAAAHLAGLDFIRAEGFVFGHLADEGYMDACAGELLRYRHAIGADGIAVFTDIKKKHSSHALTQDVDIVATAKAAAFFEADGVIVTGTSTGAEADLEEVRSVGRAVDIAVLVGSGVTLENVDRYLPHAHGLIVGSHFKEAGRWQNPVDPLRVRAFMDKVQRLRKAR